MPILNKIRHLRLPLSTKLILSMAGLVILNAVVSLLISNSVINNQTRELEDSVRKVSLQIQEVREAKAKTIPPATSRVERLRQLVNSGDTAESILMQARHTLFSNSTIDGTALLRVIKDSGFPISAQTCVGRGAGNPAEFRGVVIDKNQPVAPPIPILPGIGSSENCTSNLTDITQFYTYPIGQSIALGSLLAALCAVGIGFLLARTIIRPLHVLENASQRIADGNYSNEIKLEGHDEISRLALSFNRMAQALRQTEQKRKDLVADVSHEFRTPLSSIQGYSEVLRDGLVPSRERQEEILGHILKEVKHLTAMVNSMRAWASNEQALEHLVIENIPVRYIAEMVLERFRPLANTKGVALQLEISSPEPQVQADAEALNHALSNLIDNALRYTPTGGNIILKIEKEKVATGTTPRVLFEVRDSGCGIAPEHLPFIFERFYRVDKSRDRTTGGNGLGLAIVRDTVQTLGGEVKIESQVGYGTCILFNLPGQQPVRPGRKRRQQVEMLRADG